MDTIHTHRGVTYFATYEEARVCRDRLVRHHPAARVVAYLRGWAVQYRISGPYYPSAEG